MVNKYSLNKWVYHSFFYTLITQLGLLSVIEFIIVMHLILDDKILREWSWINEIALAKHQAQCRSSISCYCHSAEHHRFQSGLGFSQCSITSQLCNLGWVCSTPPGLNLLICKLLIIIPTLQGGCKNDISAMFGKQKLFNQWWLLLLYWERDKPPQTSRSWPSSVSQAMMFSYVT